MPAIFEWWNTRRLVIWLEAFLMLRGMRSRKFTKNALL